MTYLGSQPWPFPRSPVGFHALGDPEQPFAFRDGETAECGLVHPREGCAPPRGRRLEQPVGVQTASARIDFDRPGRSSSPGHIRSKRRLILALLIFALAIGASVSGFHISRNDTNQEAYFGDFDAPDRVEITVWITHVDPTLQTVSMTLMNIHPYGKLAVDGTANDDTMTMNSIGTGGFRSTVGGLRRRREGADRHHRLADYPFDSYDASIALDPHRFGRNDVPTAITVLNTDSFYKIEIVQADAQRRRHLDQPDHPSQHVDFGVRHLPSWC